MAQNQPASNGLPPEEQGRLISHFTGRRTQDHAAGWSDLWDTNNSDLWDRGKPSPALIDVMEERQDLFCPRTHDGRLKRALVPGCGRGYDVVMLALHGFDAYGLEVSATGVAEAQKYASAEMQKPQDYNFPDGVKPLSAAGSVTFIKGDFFSAEWESEAAEGQFDLIYDYTFLCALHPTMRKQWASRMKELLRPDGLLVCLEFPMFKDHALPGPPWSLNGVHWDLLARGGDGVTNVTSAPESTTDQLDGHFKRVLYVKPSRSYEQGRGTDMLSVYAPK